MRTRATITTTALLLAALTACSSSDDSTDAAPSSSPSAPATTSQPSDTPPATDPTETPVDDGDLEQAVKQYTDAYFAADTATAYGLLSKRCKGQMDEIVFGSLLKEATKQYGPDHPATDVKTQVSGDLARVTYKVEGLPKFDQQAQPWTREGGAWKYDAC
jgi:hypothetical protein